MRKIRFFVVLLAIFAILGGTAFANTALNHVKMAPNGEGDLLFFPWYLAASGGWQTQISVINTSNDYSTVAKVIIHSHNWSDELLDFLIYLSPNDVWTGYIRYGAQGTYIYSDDDSILVSKPGTSMVAADVATYFASPTNPVSMPLYAPKCPAASKIDSKTDSSDYGYIEVIESNATTAVGPGKQTKNLVYEWYEANTSVTQHTVNILTGYQEFQNTEAGSYSALARAQVFADWHNASGLLSSDVTGLVGNLTNNTLGELEAAMAKQNIALPYIWRGAAATLHFFTFPTKLSYTYKDTSTGKVPCDEYITSTGIGKSDFWGYSRTPFKCLPYRSTGYDLSENTVTTGPFSGGGTSQKMCEEMQWIPAYIPGDLFTEGWIRYVMGAGSSVDLSATTFRLLEPNTGIFSGAPVLSSALYIRAASISQAEAAWTQKIVTVPASAGINYPYYQYADEHLLLP